MTTLIDVTSRLPTYYEIHPGSMSDAKTVASFITRMKKYGAERIRVLLDRDFYSALNISLARRPYKLLHPRAHNGRLARRIN
jgi:transposase